jgi:G3E family GTPase
MRNDLCPITLIGGYLGAGKTTLINRMLADPELPQDTAVLVNDFGDINIDESLIRSQSQDGTVLGLSNGCICCSISDDLSKALDQLAELPISQVILETSGVAEPARVWQHCHYPGFRPKASVVLVDAGHTALRLRDKYVGSLVKAQLDQAHLLVLSKTDVHPDFRLDRLQPMIESNDPNLLATIFGWQQPTAPERSIESRASFGAHTWHQTQTVPLATLQNFLHSLNDRVHRVKGWVATDRGLHQVSGVGSTFALDVITDLPKPPALGLVFIYCSDVDSQDGGLAPDQITMTLSP